MARQKKSNNKAAKLAASRGKVPAIPPIFRMMGNAMGEQARLPMAVRASPQNQLPDAAEMSSSTEGNNQEQVCTCDKGHHHDEELDDEEDYEEGEEEAEDEEERDEDEEEDEELEDEEEDYPEYVTLREERAGTPHPHASSHEEPPPQTPPRPVAKAKYRTTTARPTSLPPPKTPPCTPPDTPDTEDGEEVLELKMDPLVRDAYLKAGILQHFEGLPEGLNEMASKIASMKPSELLDCLQTLKPVEYDRLLEKFANAQKQKKEEMPECGRLVFTHTHEVRDPKELAKMQRMMDQHKRLLKQNDALRAELEATQAEVARERLAAEMRKKSAQVGKKAEDSRKGKIRSIPTSNLKPGSSSEFDKKMADFADRASKAVMSEGMAGAVGGTAVSGQKPINPWASIDGDLSEGSGLTDAECSAFIARLRESRASGVPITPDGRALPGEVKALVDLVRQNPERHDTLLRDLQRLHHQPPANPSVHPMWLPTPEQMTSTAKSTKRAAEAAPPTLATITKEGRAELKKNAHAIMVSYLEHPNDAARAAALCQLPLSTLDDIDSDEEEALMQVLLDRMKQSAANGQSEVPEAYPGMLVMPEPPPGWTPSSPTFPDIPGFPFDPAKMDPTAYAYLDELIKRNPALYSMQPPRPTAVPQYPSGQVPYHQWAYPGYAQMPPPHPMSYAPPTPQQQAMGYGYPYGYYAVQSPAWHYVNGNLVLGVPNYPTVRHVPIFESVVTDVPDTIASGNIPLDPVTGLPKGAKVVTSIKGTMAIPVTGYPSNDFNDDIERPLPMEMDAYNARMERAMRTITANREAAMGVFKSHSQSAPTTPTPSSEASCKVQSTEPLTTNEMIERIFGTQAATATSQQQRTAVTIPPLKEGEVHAPHFGGTVTGDGIYNPMCNHVYDGTGVCVHCHRVIIFDPFPTDTSLGIRPPPMSATGVYIGQTQGYAFLMDNPGVPAPESVLKDPVELQKYQQIYNKTIEKIVPPGHQSMMYDSNLMPEQLGHFVASTGGVLSEPFDPATLPPFLRGGQQPTEMDANCRYFYSTAAAHGNLPPPEGGTMAGAYAGLSGLPPSMTKITSVRRAPSYVRQDIRAFPRMITPTPGHVKMLIGKLDIPDAESSTSYGQDPLNYEKGTVLGTGSYSAVYPGSVDKTKAANKADVEERTVAIKIVSMTDFAKYKDLKMLLDNEKHALHMCRNHPAVVQIEGFVESSSHGEAYLIFERMACDLTTYVFEHERRMLTEPTTKLISKQVLSALHYLHPKGIVHGDIRPPNVLVGERSCDYPQVKLCDFGHVRLRNGKQWSFKDLDSSTAGKARPRNRGYEAPESYDIIGFSAELDMYGLGTLAHFCLTGRPPYDPNGGSDSPATPKKDTAAPGAAPGATGTAPASTAKDKKNRRIVQRDHLRAKLAETKKAAAAASPGDKGFPPFDPVDFMAPGSVWESSISQDGRDWCESLLRHDPSQRMTRLEASHHSWINTKDCYKYGRRLETRLGIFRPSERHLTSLADDRKFMMVRLSPVKAPPATAAPETPKPTPKAPANTPRKAEPPRHPAPKR